MFPFEIKEQDIIQFELCCYWWYSHELHICPISSSALHSAQQHSVRPSLTHSLLFIILPTFFLTLFFSPSYLLIFTGFLFPLSVTFSLLFYFSLVLPLSYSAFPSSSVSFLISLISFRFCFSHTFYHDLYSYFLHSAKKIVPATQSIIINICAFHPQYATHYNTYCDFNALPG